MNYTLKVVEIRQETDDTVTLCFKQPGLKKIKYIAGQYLTLIFRINGRRYIRPYSFSSCPGVDTYLEITVKRILNGIVSNHINDRVAIGDSVEVMSPMGEFVYTHQSHIKCVYLWGVGSGITPLISIAKYILANHNDVKVNLVYGNRNYESTIFLKQLDALKNQYVNNFDVWHFHTKLSISKHHPYHIEGRIDHEKALNILSNEIEITNTSHYICGPLGLKESVKQTLFSLNVANHNIFSEDFELVKDERDFEDVVTRAVTVNFENRDFELEVIKGKSILEAALDADIELPYSCQTGSCSSCKARLLAGKTKMAGLSKERLDLADNEYLLCCTYPLTDDVYIKL